MQERNLHISTEFQVLPSRHNLFILFHLPSLIQNHYVLVICINICFYLYQYPSKLFKFIIPVCGLVDISLDLFAPLSSCYGQSTLIWKSDLCDTIDVPVRFHLFHQPGKKRCNLKRWWNWWCGKNWTKVNQKNALNSSPISPIKRHIDENRQTQSEWMLNQFYYLSTANSKAIQNCKVN